MEFSMIAAIKDAGEGFSAKAISQSTITETERTKEARKLLYAALDPLCADQADDISGAAEEMADAYTELGYQNGFLVAVRLMAECLR